MTELLPCPLCRSTELLCGTVYAEGSHEREVAVRCPACKIQAPLSSWNRRAPDDAESWKAHARQWETEANDLLSICERQREALELAEAVLNEFAIKTGPIKALSQIRSALSAARGEQ